MKTLETEWESFIDRCVPEKASAQQRSDLRAAFYCGAGSFTDILLHGTPGAKKKADFRRRFLTLYEELTAFIKQQKINRCNDSGSSQSSH